MKVFYRVHIELNDRGTDEHIVFSFDFKKIMRAAVFAEEAFKAEISYTKVWIECREYDPSDMTTVDAPCWRNLDE